LLCRLRRLGLLAVSAGWVIAQQLHPTRRLFATFQIYNLKLIGASGL
jgi:hypothetical protein